MIPRPLSFHPITPKVRGTMRADRATTRGATGVRRTTKHGNFPAGEQPEQRTGTNTGARHSWICQSAEQPAPMGDNRRHHNHQHQTKDFLKTGFLKANMLQAEIIMTGTEAPPFPQTQNLTPSVRKASPVLLAYSCCSAERVTCGPTTTMGRKMTKQHPPHR